MLDVGYSNALFFKLLPDLYCMRLPIPPKISWHATGTDFQSGFACGANPLLLYLNQMLYRSLILLLYLGAVFLHVRLHAAALRLPPLPQGSREQGE